ncbi:MAG TPA: hypothetical protein VIA06_02420 [Candidatus Dormibacteraeota bacterium]|nr:hypothetical protein [Candidatus Dormibacteraeota bacterium]
MTDREDVRRIALALPGVHQEEGQLGFLVDHPAKPKRFAWTWWERVQPRKPRVPRPEVLAVRVANQEEKQIVLASNPEKFFTEPHYNGFPAVLVRLPAVDAAELEELLINAWRCRASGSLIKELDRRG